MVDWLVIMPVPGLTQATESALSQVVALLHPGRSLSVSVVDTKGDNHLKRMCADAGAIYAKCVMEPFSWGYAANIGAFAVPVDKLCFLHSDISIPTGMLWLDALAYTLDTTHGLVAPMIDGSSPNPLQHYRGPGDIPYYQTTSYLSNACFTIKAAQFREIGGFHPALRGKDWWANYLQEVMTRSGKPAVVVPASLIEHRGTSFVGPDIQRRQNMTDFCSLMNIGAEYDYRPSVARSKKPCDRSLAVIIDGFGKSDRACDLDGYDEVVIVDSAPSREGFAKCRKLNKRWIYSPILDDHPERLAVDLAGGEEVTVLDNRVSPLVFGATGKPWKYGHGYALPQHLTDIHITNAAAGAVGDTLMLTPALTALKRRYPWLKIHVYTPDYSGPLLLNHPAIESVNLLSECPVNTEAVVVGSGIGTEGTIAVYYRELGLPLPTHQRLLDPIEIVFTSEEEAEAKEWMQANIDTSRPTIGLQLHGTWRTKNWKRSTAACKVLSRKGYNVLTFGTDNARSNRPEMDYVHHLVDQPIRKAVAILAQLDGMIAYDSGLAYAAVAVKVPLIALFGPHDPAGLIYQGAGGKMVSIRKRSPAMCAGEHGKSCRTDGGIGEVCPLRKEVGGRCIDIITVKEVVYELEEIVKRKPV